MIKQFTDGQKKYLIKRLRDIFWINDYILLDARYLKYEMGFTTKYKDLNWGSLLSLMINEKIVKKTSQSENKTEFRHPNYLYEFTGSKRSKKYNPYEHNFNNRYYLHKKYNIVKLSETEAKEEKELMEELYEEENDFLDLKLDTLFLDEDFLELEEDEENIAEETNVVSEKDIAEEFRDFFNNLSEFFNEVKFEFQNQNLSEEKKPSKNISLKITLSFE